MKLPGVTVRPDHRLLDQARRNFSGAVHLQHRQQAGARCVNLHAPGIVSTAQIKRLFMQELALVETFKITPTRATRCCSASGSVDDAGTAMRSGYMSSENIAPYLARGAVGVVSGRFIGRDGKPIPGALDNQMIGLTLDEIAAGAGAAFALPAAATRSTRSTPRSTTTTQRFW